MPVYAPRKAVFGMKTLIHVCHHRWNEELRTWELSGCKQRAEADGYVFRPDLTPKR